MKLPYQDVTRVLLADGWHVPEAGTVETDTLRRQADASVILEVITWIEIRGNPADPNNRIQVVAPFSEVLAFEVR